MGSTRVITSKYLSSVLHNGVGRYICQLQRITLQFCLKHQLSREMRDYIEEHLVEFAEQNPQIVLYVTPHTKYQSPKIVAEYLNGNVSKVDVVKQEREEIGETMGLLRTQSGQEVLKTIRPWRAMNPSVQGIWHPFMHKSQKINQHSFPNENPTKRPHYLKHELLQNMSQDLKEELRRLEAKSSEAALQRNQSTAHA